MSFINEYRILSTFVLFLLYFHDSAFGDTPDPSLLSTIGCSHLITNKHRLYGRFVCQKDRPDLFEAKQCMGLDCFCVNVTDGSKIPKMQRQSLEISCDSYEIMINLVVDARAWTRKQQDLNLDNELRKQFQSLVDNNSANGKIVALRRRDRETPDSLFYYFDIELEMVGSKEELQDLLKLIESRVNEGRFGSVPVSENLTTVKNQIKPNPEPNWKSVETARDQQRPIPSLQQPRSLNVVPMDSKELYPNEEGAGRSDRKEDREDAYSSGWPISWGNLKDLLKQPGIFAGVVGAAITVIMLLILLIVFCVYRLRKRDEGSYALDEPKKLLTGPSSTGGGSTSYARAANREFYA